MNMNAPGSARRSNNPLASTSAPSQARFRPWEQQDLLHRLHTFKPRNWFGKPSHISALICARHGWINTGPDKLACEFCGESLELHVRPKWSLKDVEKAAKSHSSKLTTGHAESCPWRDTVCDASLGRFPKLPARDVYLDYNQRYTKLNQLSALPAIDSKALATVQKTHRKQLAAAFEKQLQGAPATASQLSNPSDATSTSLAHGLSEHGTDIFTQRACLLATCGWQPHYISKPPASRLAATDATVANSSLTDSGLTESMAPGTCDMQLAALACSMCGAKVGLWGFIQQTGQQGAPLKAQDGATPLSDSARTPAAPNQGVSQPREVSRKPSVRIDLTRTIAGGALGAAVPSSMHADQPVAPFGQASHTPAFGSDQATAAFGSSHTATAFGSKGAAPAFGSKQTAQVFGSKQTAAAFGSGHVTPSLGSQHTASGAASQQPSSGSSQEQSVTVFGSQQATAAFGPGAHAAAFGSGTSMQAYGAFGSADAPFGSGLHRPAFGSGSGFGSVAPRAAAATPTAAANGLDTDAGRLQEGAANQAAPISSTAGQREPLSMARPPAGVEADEGPFGSKASLPAFGMAVLRSPPTSRSPSLHGSRSNSVTPATLPPTETPPDTRESAPNEAVGSKRKRGLETEANGVAVEGSEGGKQPRMQAEGTRQQLDGGHVQADAQNLAFKALSHHKSFCPWVSTEQPDAAVCGWQWYLESLAAHWGSESVTEARPLQTPSKRLRQALAAIGK